MISASIFVMPSLEAQYVGRRCGSLDGQRMTAERPGPLNPILDGKKPFEQTMGTREILEIIENGTA